LESYSDNRKKGILIVLSGVFFISLDPLLIRFSATDSWNTVFWFGVFTFISMSTYVRVVDKTSFLRVVHDGGIPIVAYSLFMCGSATSLILSVKLTLASNTIIILSATPLFAAVLSFLFLKEVAPLRTWVAIVICIAGITFVFYGSAGKGNLLGDYFALQTTFCVASLHTILRKYKHISRTASVGLGGLFVGIFSFFMSQPFDVSWQSLAVLALFGFVTAPLARVLIGTATRYISAPEVGLVSLSNMFMAPLWVWVAFGEIPKQESVTGGIIILGTLVVHTVMNLKSEKR
jgi:drug/metabolite transporter (DMT)-like permease